MLSRIINWSISHKRAVLIATIAVSIAGSWAMLRPDGTGVGCVMQYILADTSGNLNLAQLRSIEDFVVRPALTSVPGVAEIASLGGFEKEYQVDVDPAKLLAFGIPLEEVADAV